MQIFESIKFFFSFQIKVAFPHDVLEWHLSEGSLVFIRNFSTYLYRRAIYFRNAFNRRCCLLQVRKYFPGNDKQG